MQSMQKRLYFLNNFLFNIHIVIKNFIINLIYLIKCTLQQNRKSVSLSHRNETMLSEGDQHEYPIIFL